MKKILPLASPAVRAYSKHAHVFSILGARSSLYLPWIYNYYVQLSVPESPHQFAVDYLIPSIFQYAPNLYVSRIERNVAFGVKTRILDFIKFQIEMGYYIYTYFAVDRIAAYHCEPLQTHDPLIYGYDDEREEIYLADTYPNGHYTHRVASYDEIISAAGAESEWTTWERREAALDVICMKYKDLDVHFEFNKEMYASLLMEYLEQKNSKSLHWGVAGWSKGKKAKRIYGIGIYSSLQQHVHLIGEEKREIDIRGVYVIVEHKQIMEKAIECSLGTHWKKQYPYESQLYQEIVKKVTILLNLCLKYNFTKKNEIHESISRYIAEIKCMEKEFWEKIVLLLQNE